MASNMSDSSYYIGACADCNVTLDDAHAQYSALGYSGTNSGGHLIVQNSEFDNNKTGFSTNSQNNDDAPSPQDGMCPAEQPAPPAVTRVGSSSTTTCTTTTTRMCRVTAAPVLGRPVPAWSSPAVANDTVINNRFENNASWAVLLVPFPDTDTPPAIAHCEGGDPNGIPALSIKGCYFADWGNEIASNTFANNGSYGNATNGDIGNLADQHDPGNCFHDNTNKAGAVSTAPADLQTANGTCGQANAGANLTSDLSAQVICATEAFSKCPPTPGMSYPRLDKLVLPALTPQVSMPDPCAGVPSNPWCKKS